MKILLISIALTTCLQFAFGQSANETDLVEILNLALKQDKLQNELIHKSNPEIAPWTNAPFVVVKSDTTKNLRRMIVPPDSTHVWIFNYEDIFMLDIAYGLVPVTMSREQDRVTLEYKTIKYPTNNTNVCHSGQLIAEKKNSTWTIVKSTMKEMKCEIDVWGHKK